MGASTEPCPLCGKYMTIGKLKAWNETKKDLEGLLYIEEDEKRFAISTLRCEKCGHLKIVLD